MTPTEAALEAARKVVTASEGVRLPLDTGRDTPDEELWGALLHLRNAVRALDAERREGGEAKVPVHVLRHAVQRNHAHQPIACSGCLEVELALSPPTPDDAKEGA